jgi:hypothetical protein
MGVELVPVLGGCRVTLPDSGSSLLQAEPSVYSYSRSHPRLQVGSLFGSVRWRPQCLAVLHMPPSQEEPKFKL